MFYLHGSVELLELERDTLIGSAPSCDLVLNDERVAPEHCLIRVARGGHLLMPREADLPTFINGVQLAGPVELKPDDIFVVGDTPLAYMQHSRLELREVALRRVVAPRAVIHPPDAGDAQVELALENRRLGQFEAACRALAKCTDVPMVMDVMLIAAEQIGDATYARIKLKHKTGNVTEKTRGTASAEEPDEEAPRKSGVIRITRTDEKVTSEVAIAIHGRGPVDGAIWLRVDGEMRHREHHLLQTLCDLAAITIAAFAAG